MSQTLCHVSVLLLQPVFLDARPDPRFRLVDLLLHATQHPGLHLGETATREGVAQAWVQEVLLHVAVEHGIPREPTWSDIADAKRGGDLDLAAGGWPPGG